MKTKDILNRCHKMEYLTLGLSHNCWTGYKCDITEPPQDKTNRMACELSEYSDQPGHPPSLIRVFAVRMKKAWVLSFPLSAQRRLIRLGGCPGWSESSLGAYAILLFFFSWGGSYEESNTRWNRLHPEQRKHLMITITMILYGILNLTPKDMPGYMLRWAPGLLKAETRQKRGSVLGKR